MSSDGQMGTRKQAPAEAAARLLQESWPALTVLTPAGLGLGNDTRSTIQFLEIVQSLSDCGFLTYEALLVQPGGPAVIDAALTARGRAALANRTWPID